MTGTVLSQIISYSISPILTRIYSTEEMGDLGIYMRVVGFISALATARYEMSLPLPKNDSHSFLLLRLSIRIAMFTMLFCTVIGLIFLFTRPFSLYEVFFVFISLLSSAFLVIINLGTNWAIRKKQFTKISNSKISNSLVSNGLRLGFGVIGWGSFGLLLSSLIGYLISSIGFLKEFFRNEKFFRKYKSKKKTSVLIAEYREFPLISLPHVLLDLGRDVLIAFIIVLYFGKDCFGSYSFSIMMLSLPLAIAGQSIGQVFFNKCSEIINNNGSIEVLLKKTLTILFLLSSLPFCVLFFWSEELFQIVFGEKWSVSGQYTEILTVWIFFNFLISPLSNIPIVLNRQKNYFYIGIIATFCQLFIFGVLPLIIGTTKSDFTIVLWSLSISQAIIMIFTTFIFIRYAKSGRKVV